MDHVKLSMDRGVSWEAATAFKKEMEDRLEEAEPGRTHKSGFYTQRGKTTMLNGQREQQGVSWACMRLNLGLPVGGVVQQAWAA